MAAGRFAAAIAENRAAAFIGHADGGEEGPGIGACVLGNEGQPCFFVHFPDAGLHHVFAVLYQPRGKFIDVAAQGIAVLADQNHLVLLLAVNTVEDHAVGLILVGHGFQPGNLLCPGGHIIRRNTSVPVDGLEFIEIQKPGIGLLLNIANFAHGGSSLRL